MEMQVEPLDNGITKVTLIGRMDILGTSKIDLKFSTVAGSEKRILVVMTQVEFLASIGIRTLLTGAKTVKVKKGKMVLYNPQPNVAKVLSVTGIEPLIPVFQELQLACDALMTTAEN